jgi:BirA family biotin operon repressor/biotin-[acetyl-CoA-carboxylase] ligase
MIRLGRPLIELDETPSTNDVCWQHAANDAPEGLAVSALHQTRGRGRFGRSWHAPAGLSVAVSVLLRPTLPPNRLPLLTAAAAVASCETARAFAGPSAAIRWPNDVVSRGRKLAGVIVEGRDGSAWVLGCGINVNLLEADFPDDLRSASTSLRIESGAAHDRQEVLRKFLERLDRRYDEALSGDPALGRDWRDLSALVGRRVEISEAGTTCAGEVVDLDVLEGISIRLTHAVRRFRLEHVERLREA